MSYLTTLRGLSRDALYDELEAKIQERYYDLLGMDPAASEIAMTNTTGWSMCDLEILDDVEDLDLTSDEVHVRFACQGEGDQDDDKPWCGDKLAIEATAALDSEGRISFDQIEAKRNWPDREDEGDSEPDGETA